MFCTLSDLCDKQYMHLDHKLSKELKLAWKFLDKQFQAMDQGSENVVWINNSKTPWPTYLIFCKMHVFFTNVLKILRQNTKKINFWSSSPLSKNIFSWIFSFYFGNCQVKTFHTEQLLNPDLIKDVGVLRFQG